MFKILTQKQMVAWVLVKNQKSYFSKKAWWGCGGKNLISREGKKQQTLVMAEY
jgi:hypothetical protein